MNSKRFISPVNLQQLEAFFGPGRPIPNVNSRDFDSWLEKLELSDPDGALRVRDCLEVAEVPEAVAMQQKKAQKENRQRARWTQLLYRIDETGKTVPDKAKMQIVGASALLMAALVFVGLVVVRPAEAIGVNTSLSNQLSPGAMPARSAAAEAKDQLDAANAAAAARGNAVAAIGPDGKPVLGPDGNPIVVPKPPASTSTVTTTKVATPAAVGSAPSTTMTNYDAAPASSPSNSGAAGSDPYGSSGGLSGGSSGGRSGVSSAGGGAAGGTGAGSMNGLPRAAPVALASPVSGSGQAAASKAQLGGSERTRGLLAVGARLPSAGSAPSGGADPTGGAVSGNSSAGGSKPAIGTGAVAVPPAPNTSNTPSGMAVGAVASAPVREVPSAAMSSGTGVTAATRPNGGTSSPMGVFTVASGTPSSGVARSDPGSGVSGLGGAPRGSTPAGGVMIGGRAASVANPESVGSSGGSSAGGFSAGGGAVNATPGIPGGSSGLPAGTGGAATDQSQSQSGSNQPTLRSLSSLYPSLYIGARIKARVVLDIVAVEQGETPIVAETTDFPCGASDCPRITWIGVARLGPDRRIWAQFNQAVVGSETFAVIGQAYGATDLRLGLPASVQDEAPSLISDLVRGTIGGLSDFLKSSLGAQTTTIIPGGGAQQSSSVPGLESFFLGRVGDLFSIPSGSKALIRVARTPLNTEINILYGVAQNYAGSGTR